LDPAAIRVEHLSKRFRLYHQRHLSLKQSVLNRGRARYEEFWAVRDVSFEVRPRSALGIIGENGSGKSTLLKCIAGILEPEEGAVHTRGRLAALLELGAGFHPEYSGRENIYLNGALLGLPRNYIDTVLDDIVDFSELHRFIDNPVKTYSSGMHARLGFAISVYIDPDILVVDEILGVGDEGFQRRCFDRIAHMKAEGKTLVVVSHALEAIREVCTDCVWMDGGKARAHGPVETVINDYLTEVNARESQMMQKEVAKVRELVPTGRDGVGISTVRFFANGEEAQVVETGCDFETQIEYHSPKPLRGARFSVSFVREDGVMALSCTTDDDAMRATTLPATGVIRLTMPNLPLLEGLFRVGVAITEMATDEPWTLLEQAFPFRVRTANVKERGVALLGHRWEIPQDSGRTSISA
jgi:ABC-2 type transport system ATP-binding protein